MYLQYGHNSARASELVILLKKINLKMKKEIKSANNGSKKRERSTTSKETQLSEKAQDFIKAYNRIFGELVSDFIEERLIGLSDEMQYELVWHILHYLYRDEILPTGDPDVDIKITEIIEKLPFINVELFRYLSRDKIAKMEKNSEGPQYAS